MPRNKARSRMEQLSDENERLRKLLMDTLHYFKHDLRLPESWAEAVMAELTAGMDREYRIVKEEERNG